MPTATYYFNGHSASAWTDPNNFDDGNIATFASVSSDSDIHEFISNTCPGTDLGTILKVELRVHGKGDGSDQIELRPVFVGGDGDVHETVPVVDPGGWTAYVDITNDTNAPDWSAWSQVQALDCDANRDAVGKSNTMYGSVVEIRVTYHLFDIDIGVEAISRSFGEEANFTLINMGNPANASGTLHTIEVYARTNITGLRVGTFYTTNGNTLKCRDSVVIGAVEAGAVRTFNGLSITVEAGDYIGCFYTAGGIAWDVIGFDGLWEIAGEYIDPNDETEYGFLLGDAISLYGYGDIEAPPAAIPRHGFVNFQDPGIV